MAQNKGASAEPTGLGAPEGAEPQSRLVATPAIPSAAPNLPRLLDLAAAANHHETAYQLEALRERLGRDGLSMDEWNALIGAASHLRIEAWRRERRASAIEARSGETVKHGSTEGESAVGATSAETPTLSSPRRG